MALSRNVKIGLAVGGLLLAAGVIYAVIKKKSGSELTTEWLRAKTFTRPDRPPRQTALQLGFDLILNADNTITVTTDPNLVGVLTATGINWSNGASWDFDL